MTVASKWENLMPNHAKKALRSATGFLVVALAVGAVLLVFYSTAFQMHMLE